MKIKFKFQLVILFFLVNCSSVSGQWQYTSFPVNGVITALTSDETKVYSGSQVWSGGNSIHTYTNSWSNGTLYMSNRISSVLIKNAIIFAAAWLDAGVQISTDGGVTWTPSYAGLPTNMVGQLELLNALASNDSIVFVGTGVGVYKTTTDGALWSSAGLTNKDILSLAVSGTTLYAGTSGGGVFSSTDNGNTWLSINNGLTDTIINSIVATGNTILAGTDNGVFRSVNKGASWTALNSGFPSGKVNVVFNKGSILVAGTDNFGIYISDNDGYSWAPANTGLFANKILSITARKNSLFAGTNGGGVAFRPILEMVGCFANNTVSFDSITNIFTISIDSSTSAMATAYHWDFGDGTTSTLANPSHAYAVDSIYNVCMKIINASGDSCTYCISIGKDTAGNPIFQKKSAGFMINVTNGSPSSVVQHANITTDPVLYPNPFSTYTTIRFSKEQTYTTIKVIDILGRTAGVFQILNSDQIVIDKADLKSGTYMLQISDSNNQVTYKKVLIQ